MTKNKQAICKGGLFIALILANSIFISAITGSMGNARMVLYPEVDGKNTVTIEKSILVRNVNSAAINITLKADENSTNFLEVIDKSFILEPNEEKKANFVVKVKNEGTYNGKINVFFAPIDSKEPGVVLSSSITVIAKKTQDDGESLDNSEEDVNDGNNGDGSPITGGAIGTSNEDNGISSKIPTAAIFLIIMSVILLVIIIVLLLIKSKKLSRKTENNKNKKGKK